MALVIVLIMGIVRSRKIGGIADDMRVIEVNGEYLMVSKEEARGIVIEEIIRRKAIKEKWHKKKLYKWEIGSYKR